MSARGRDMQWLISLSILQARVRPPPRPREEFRQGGVAAAGGEVQWGGAVRICSVGGDAVRLQQNRGGGRRLLALSVLCKGLER